MTRNIHYKVFEEDEFVKIDSKAPFIRWIKLGGWNNEIMFEKTTGVRIDELIGKWFYIVNNRIYVKNKCD